MKIFNIEEKVLKNTKIYRKPLHYWDFFVVPVWKGLYIWNFIVFKIKPLKVWPFPQQLKQNSKVYNISVSSVTKLLSCLIQIFLYISASHSCLLFHKSLCSPIMSILYLSVNTLHCTRYTVDPVQWTLYTLYWKL